MCVLLITQRCGKWEGWCLVNRFNHTSWVVIVTPTDRPMSVRNRCEIEVLVVFLCCVCRGLCHSTKSDLFIFLLQLLPDANCYVIDNFIVSSVVLFFFSVIFECRPDVCIWQHIIHVRGYICHINVQTKPQNINKLNYDLHDTAQ